MIKKNAPAILVCGATGLQGGAVIKALIDSDQGWNIRALTRDLTSKGALRLQSKGVKLVAGNMQDVTSLVAAMQDVQGVFSVQANFFDDQHGREIEYGKNVANAAKNGKVSHIVYSSVGGADRNSGIPHFEAKWDIEQHIAAIDLNATILRPATFMDNFKTTMMRTILLSMFKTSISPERKLQLVSVRDIGRFAAMAFEQPEVYRGKQIELAGDARPVKEIIEVLKSNKFWPVLAVQLPELVRRRLPADFTALVDWFQAHGFEADIETLRHELPDLQTLEDWAARL